jgi:hypothetical protein
VKIRHRCRVLERWPLIRAVAVAIAIETVAPVRASNLATIRLDENLTRPGGIGSNYLLVFPHYDVKNRVDLTFEGSVQSFSHIWFG